MKLGVIGQSNKANGKCKGLLSGAA
jgi:hypothetical protein